MGFSVIGVSRDKKPNEEPSSASANINRRWAFGLDVCHSVIDCSSSTWAFGLATTPHFKMLEGKFSNEK